MNEVAETLPRQGNDAEIPHYQAGGYYGREQAHSVSENGISDRDAETFAREGVVLQTVDAQASREHLFAAEQNPEIIFGARTLATAFSNLEKQLGKPVLWGVFGSLAYQIESKSMVTKPDDIDGFFDITYTNKLYIILQRMAEDPQYGIALDSPSPTEVGSTGAQLIAGQIAHNGKVVDFEFFGQSMGDPTIKNGYVDVGTGARNYTINRFDVSGEPLNVLDAKGQSELYLRRILLEFQQGLDDVSAETFKFKVAHRLFRVMRLLGEYHSEAFVDTLKYVVQGFRQSGKLSEVHAVQELREMFEEFTDLVSAQNTEGLGAAPDYDQLEAELYVFSERCSADVMRLRVWNDGGLRQLAQQIQSGDRSEALKQNLDALNAKVSELVLSYGDEIAQLDDYAKFAQFAQIHQVLSRVASPIFDTIDDLYEAWHSPRENLTNLLNNAEVA